MENRIKDKLLELRNLYEEMKKEAFRIVEKIKQKVLNITDAIIVQSLIEKADFYWKHDLLTIKRLADKYKIKTSKLDKIWKKYINLEQKIIEKKKDFERLGLKNISFGPKSITAFTKEGLQIYIYIDIKKQNLDIRVYPKNESIKAKDFEKLAEKLKSKIENFLQEKF